MNADQARAAVLNALSRIAPEVDVSGLDPEVDLREQADLDSMDVLSLVAQVSDATGVPVDEDDYDQFDTLARAVGFLVRRGGAVER